MEVFLLLNNKTTVLLLINLLTDRGVETFMLIFEEKSVYLFDDTVKAMVSIPFIPQIFIENPHFK